MTDAHGAAEVLYSVVVNSEGQYSIWPAHRPVPRGWVEDGFCGPQADCLAHIRQVWTDMRPLSLRQTPQNDAARD
ncbi:MAG: MbtH family NRPS accessory protein [Anaerolineae bacterium]